LYLKGLTAVLDCCSQRYLTQQGVSQPLQRLDFTAAAAVVIDFSCWSVSQPLQQPSSSV